MAIDGERSEQSEVTKERKDVDECNKVEMVNRQTNVSLESSSAVVTRSQMQKKKEK